MTYNVFGGTLNLAQSIQLWIFTNLVAATESSESCLASSRKRYASAHTIDLCGESHRRYVTELSAQPQVSGFLRLPARRRTPSPSVQLTDWI